MNFTLRLLCVALGIAAGLSGCENCGPSGEPTLQVNLTASRTFRLDTVYGVGAVGRLPSSSVQFRDTSRYQTLTLPLSLRADSVRYVFVINGKPEQLTVFYRRDYAYRNKTCGYVLNVYAPTGKGPQALTTVGTIGSVNYEQNSYQVGVPNPGRESGIGLSLRL